MPAIRLSPAERKAQRALAHHLDPVVMVGAEGITPAVMRELDAALSAHGLIKVRVFADDRQAREEMLHRAAGELGAAPVQHIGKLLVLWRPLPPKEKAARDDRMPGPKVVKVVKFSRSGNHRPQVKKVRVLGNERVAAGGEIKRARRRAASPKKSAAD